MNTVEPIRDKEVVRDIADYLKDRNIRDYVMFMFGIYSGLRISDILKLRVRDVKGKNHISMREKKTGKEKRFVINKELKRILSSYIEGKKDYEYLFKSQKGKNKPIGRVQAYRIMTEAGKEFGLDEIGTHTLRKTFGYHMYQKDKDVAVLMEIFNHSEPSITLRYIGITQNTQDKAINELHF